MSLAQVSKTALLTLRARAEEHQRKSGCLDDPEALRWFEALPWPAELDPWYSDFAQAKTAIRARQLDDLVRALRGASGAEVIVELGCGFSTRRARLGSEAGRWLALDLPEVMAHRAALGEDPSVEALSGSVLEPEWLAAVQASGPQVILLAEGLLYYLAESDVLGLMTTLRQRLPGAVMLFDVIGELDFARSQAASTRLGAPVQWMAATPFSQTMLELGLDPVVGFEAERILNDTVQGFSQRYGPLLGFGLKQVARVSAIAERRSGIMLGRLRPLT